MGNLHLNASDGSVVLINGADVRGRLDEARNAHEAMKAQVVALRTEVAVMRARVNPARLYCIGGFRNDILRNVSIFDGVTWRESAATPSAARFKSAAVVFLGVLYVLGGGGNTPTSSVERFNGTTWASAPSMQFARSGLGAVVYNGGIFAMGGDTTRQMEMFNGSQWSLQPQMLQARSDFGCVVYNGSIFIIGGRVDSMASGSSERFGNNIWTMAPSLLTPRQFMRAAVFADKIYAVGGFSGNLQYVNAVEVSDGIDWKVGPSMLGARGGHGLVVYFGSLYAISGYNGTYTETVERFDGSVWRTDTSMSDGVSNPSVVVF